MLNFVLGYKNEPNFEQLAALVSCLEAFVKPKFSAELRTAQQTGYIVKTDYTTGLNVVYLTFTIQSNRYGLGELVKRTYEFLEGKLLSAIKNCDEKTFSDTKQGLISNLREKYKDLSGYYSNALHEIKSDRKKFDWKSELIGQISAITLEDV